MAITVGDIRKAIEGMPDDAPIDIYMADPFDDVVYGIDGVGNYGGVLIVSISEHFEDEDDDWDDDFDDEDEEVED